MDALFSPRRDEPENQFESSLLKYADPSNLERSLLEGNEDHLLNQARSELMRQKHQVGSLNDCISELQQLSYAQRLELQDAQHGYVEPRCSNTKCSWIGWDEESSRTTSWRILSAKIERKSRHNTEAQFSTAGNARTNEFFEWFGWISRSGIGSQWEIVLRFQSACRDSKLSFHAEPRQTLASWHMECIGITGKRFCLSNFLRLIHTKIIIKEFYFFGLEKKIQKINWLLVLILHRKQCYGSKKWRWLDSLVECRDPFLENFQFLEMLDAKIAFTLKKIIHNSRGTESPESGSVSTRTTDRIHDLRQLSSDWRSWYSVGLCWIILCYTWWW